MNTHDSLSLFSDEQIYNFLKFLEEDEEDCYATEFLGNEKLEWFVVVLYFADLVWISSDWRLLVTNRGQQLMELLVSTVELTRKPRKVKRYGNKLIK